MDTENGIVIKKARVRTSPQQQTTLVNYMCSNASFAKTHARRQSRHEWKNLAKTLNTLGHPKSILQWVKVWNDLKRNTRRSTLATPPGQRIQLSEIENKVLDLLQGDLFHDHREKVTIIKKGLDEKYLEMTSTEAPDVDSLSWDWNGEDTSESKNEADSTCGQKHKHGNKETGYHRRVRGNSAQASYMIEFMRKHKEMAQYPTFKNQFRAEWNALSRRLNVLGPKRTANQWKKVWRGHRTRAIRYFDEHGRDTNALKSKAREITLQILDILDLNESTAVKPTRSGNMPSVEDVKYETDDGAVSHLSSGINHSIAADIGNEDTPVVSWEWDPVGNERGLDARHLSPSSLLHSAVDDDDDDDTPLCSTKRNTKRLKSQNSYSMRQILKNMEESRKFFNKATEKQTALLEKFVEQSLRSEERRAAMEQRSMELQERMVALQERLVSLGERTLLHRANSAHDQQPYV